jgi:hypothetical protein
MFTQIITTGAAPTTITSLYTVPQVTFITNFPLPPPFTGSGSPPAPPQTTAIVGLVPMPPPVAAATAAPTAAPTAAASTFYGSSTAEFTQSGFYPSSTGPSIPTFTGAAAKVGSSFGIVGAGLIGVVALLA